MDVPKRKPFRVGAALSLDKFAHAKQSTYDPRINKERDRTIRSKTFGKYQKLKKKLADKIRPGIRFKVQDKEDEDLATTNTQTEEAEADVGANPEHQQRPSSSTSPHHHTSPSNKHKPYNNHTNKPPSRLERIGAITQAQKQAEADEREQRRLAAEQRKAKLQADASRRQKESKAFRKKNARGQPVMKGRLDKLLHKIEASA